MDADRYIEEGKEQIMREIMEKADKKKPTSINNVNYRLMQEWEVPEWIKIKPEDPNKNADDYGMGKR